MKYLLILIMITVQLKPAIAAGLRPMMNGSFGIVNISVNENESTLEVTDTDIVADGESGAESVNALATSFEVQYESQLSEKRNYVLKAMLPVSISGEGVGIFLLGGGVNFYLNPMGSNYSLNVRGTTLSIIPRYRYYWGMSTSFGYLIYNTVSAKKSDVFFDLGAHLGGAYNFGKDWALRGEAGIARGIGVTTTSMSMKVLLGVTYYL